MLIEFFCILSTLFKNISTKKPLGQYLSSLYCIVTVLAFISSSKGTQYTSLRPQSQPLFMSHLILTWTQAQFKLLQQSCHEHSSLNLSECLPNTGPWAKWKRKEYRVWNLSFCCRWKSIRVKLHWFLPCFRMPVHYKSANIYGGSPGEEVTSNVFVFGGNSCRAWYWRVKS